MIVSCTVYMGHQDGGYRIGRGDSTLHVVLLRRGQAGPGVEGRAWRGVRAAS